MHDHGYLIRKRGVYYRPNSQGYTACVCDAGRYSLSDAIAITHPNGMDGPRDSMAYVHESQVGMPQIVRDRERLEAENKKLKAALAVCANHADDMARVVKVAVEALAERGA